MDGGGIIAAGTYDSSKTPNATYLINASTGKRDPEASSDFAYFAQSAFAGGWLFMADLYRGLRLGP